MLIAPVLNKLFDYPHVIQEAIAEELTAAGLTVHQTKVGKWLKGTQVPRISELVAIERIRGLPKGWILAQAGLVDLAALNKLTNENFGVAAKKTEKRSTRRRNED